MIKTKELKKMEYLQVQDGQTKSFYKKASIKRENNYILLYSYNLLVAKYNEITKKIIIYGYHSLTTGRHINNFLLYVGLPKMTKKEILKKVKENKK